MFKHILVPLDGSHFAEAALQHALLLVEKFHSHLTILRVATSPQLYMSEFVLGLPDAADLYVQLRQQALIDAEGYLAGIEESLATQAADSDFVVEESTQVADAIVQTAARLGADLIVMTTHGRSGLQRWMLGSVAESVVREAQVPVLLVRSTAAGATAAPAEDDKELVHV